MPSQFLSAIASVGLSVASVTTHTQLQVPHAPLAQVCEQAAGLLPHVRTAPLMHAHPSSAVPSQSLSTPSQTSALGPTPPVHAPHLPPEQACVPSLHTPRLVPHAWT